MNESILKFSVMTDLTTYVNDVHSQIINHPTSLNASGQLTSQLAKKQPC